MATGTCSIDDCERPTTGRTLCGAHYERNRRYGDPLAGGPFRNVKAPQVCIIDGCVQYAKARGWCAVHYQRWKTSGDPGTAELLRTPGDPALTEKPCRRCNVVKPMADFHNEPRNRDGRASHCKSCYEKQQFVPRLSRKYGITEDEYKALVVKHDGKCGMCSETAKLVVDHCHKSGKVRALLCDRCNRLLGVADDRIELLQAAIAFLGVHKEA